MRLSAAAFFTGWAAMMTAGLPLICVSGRHRRMDSPACTLSLMSLPSKRGLKRVADDELERAAGGQRLECRRDLFGLHAHVQDDKIVGDFGQVDVEGERRDHQPHSKPVGVLGGLDFLCRLRSPCVTYRRSLGKTTQRNGKGRAHVHAP